jgi:hypothetical protein
LTGNVLHVRYHFIEPFGLLSELGLVYESFTFHDDSDKSKLGEK